MRFFKYLFLQTSHKYASIVWSKVVPIAVPKIDGKHLFPTQSSFALALYLLVHKDFPMTPIGLRVYQGNAIFFDTLVMGYMWI